MLRCIFVVFILAPQTMCDDKPQQTDDAPRLRKELQQLDWLLGEWRPEELEFSNANWIVREAYPIQIRAKNEGADIELRYKYEYMSGVFPPKRRAISVLETIYWNKEQQRLEIAIQLAPQTRLTCTIKKVKNNEWELQTHDGQKLGVLLHDPQNSRIQRWIPFPHEPQYESSLSFIGNRAPENSPTK